MAEATRVHGGIDACELRALGLAPAAVLDLSVNLNPYGPCDAVRDALARCAVDRYPDARCSAARTAIAEALGVDADGVVLGNGASELLWTLARVLAPVPSVVAIAEPAFGELRAAAQALGHWVVAVRGREERGYGCDPYELSTTIQRMGAAFAYLCNPSSPTGHALSANECSELAQRSPSCWFLLDESFLSLSDHHANAAEALPPNVIRVRSLTKDHALPGVRVGYALMPPEIARRVECARPSWTVSAHAQAVAEVALGQQPFLARSRALLGDDRAALVAGLRDLGYAPLPSCAPYVTWPVGSARALRARLLERAAVLVRDCSSFGLPHLVRVAVRPEPERARLLEALRKETHPCHF